MRILLLAAVIILTVISFSCNSAPDVVRIGYLPLSSNLPLFVAMKNGYFTEIGIKPELIPFQTSNALTEALAAGDIDAEAGASTFVTLAVAQTSVDKLRVVMGISVSPAHPISALLIHPNSTVNSVKDLRGKKVGCFPGAAIKSFARLYLERHQAYDENMSLIELPPTLQLQALANGSIDAVFALEPIPSLGLVKNAAKILERAPIENEILNPWVGGVYSVSRDFEKTHRDIIHKYTAALRKAIDFTEHFPDSAKSAMTAYTPMQDAAALKLLPIPEFIMSDSLSSSDFQKLADLLLAQGILKRRVNVSELLK